MRDEPWKTLFIKALQMLNSANIKQDEWTFGGGTALMLYFNHRTSYDIDIFLHDVNIIGLLTPRLNRAIAGTVADYTEASNFLKLKYPEGEIDFILAPFLTSIPWQIQEIEGSAIRVETPEEIIIKKLFYRAELLKSRDVFDSAVVFANRKQQLLNESRTILPKYETLTRRWGKIKHILNQEFEAMQIIDTGFIPLVSDYFESYLDSIKKNSFS